MQNDEPNPLQFTLREIVLVAGLAASGMAVLSTFVFASMPVVGSVIALCATVAGSYAVLRKSEANTPERFFALPVAIATAMAVLLFLVLVLPQMRPSAVLVFLLEVALPVSFGLIVSLILFPADQQKPGRYGSILVSTVLIAILGSVIVYSFLRSSVRTPAMETAVSSACKALAEAQEIYHRTDYDGDGILEYAQAMHGDNSLLEHRAGAEDLLLIDPAFAQAAWDHPQRVPKYGYFFKLLNAMREATFLDGKGNQTRAHAALAFPDKYDEGRWTFIISSTGVIYKKDLGPDTKRIAAGITCYAVDYTWIECE